MPVVPESEWKWFGSPGHFVAAFNCRFHLCTHVGPWLVSTVGEWFPDAPVRELLAESRGINLVGVGDARDRDYQNRIGFEDIGCDRKYETMVFQAGAPCDRPDCNCGLPDTNGQEIEMDGYNDRGAATNGHMELCRKYAALDIRAECQDQD